MKEIGGFFELENFNNCEYYKDFIPLNTARNALLLLLLLAKKIDKIYIPYYLCDSISIMLDKNNYSYEYYNINENFEPIFNKTLKNNEYLYIVNYFGQIKNEKILDYKSKYNNIIVDNVQAFFQKPVENIDTIYSCRKFFGVPDGSYLYTDAKLNKNIEIDKSSNRMKHLLGRYEYKASEFYDDFKDNDEQYKNLEPKYMSLLTHNILGAIDYEKIIEKRNINYKYLNDKLYNHNKLKLSIPIGPYCYPLYVENGMKIKKALAKQYIYIPTLWPNVLKLNDCLEKDYTENILPIPCDQRYNIVDMEYVCNNIINTLNKI